MVPPLAPSAGSGFRAEAAEPPVEPGELAAGVEQALLAAGPRRMRFRIDLQAQGVAGFAVGRARRIAAAIGHHDRDLVVVGVNFFLHRSYLGNRPIRRGSLYSGAASTAQSSVAK